MSVRAHGSGLLWANGPDILVERLSRSVLLHPRVCLKIPSHGPLDPAGQTPSVLGGVRVIHSRHEQLLVSHHSLRPFYANSVECSFQPIYCNLSNSILMCATYCFIVRLTEEQQGRVQLLLVIGLFRDEINMSEADI